MAFLFMDWESSNESEECDDSFRETSHEGILKSYGWRGNNLILLSSTIAPTFIMKVLLKCFLQPTLEPI